MDYRKNALRIIRYSVFFAIILLLLFIFRTTEWDFSKPINTDIFSNYGTLVGGLTTAALSIASIFLIIQTINENRHNIIKQQIESRFFELIKIHRENRSEITNSNMKQEISFKDLIDEYGEIFSVVEKINNESEKKLPESVLINITYLCFYYGIYDKGSTGDYTFQLISKYLNQYFSGQSKSYFLEAIGIRNEKLRLAGKFNFELFMGHQSTLGHYYRHIYQTVKYIDEQDSSILDDKEKYNYIKILRAQLSTQEQILFCFNSLSDLGGIWELNPGTPKHKRLITKYNLIKNIPVGIIRNYFDIKKYYPFVKFEIDEEKSH